MNRIDLIKRICEKHQEDDDEIEESNTEELDLN